MKRSLVLACVLLVLFGSLLIAQDRTTFKVGSATAARGQKISGVIEVPAGVDAALSIPVVVVHGMKPGPILALVAGAHGTEYASIIALEKLIEKLNPADISGTVVIVPLVNIPSFEKKVPHVNPVDGKSMNRFYPGKADGTQTERASFQITKQIVERSDYLIDLHGGDLDESLRPYSYWVRTDDEKLNAVTREMVMAFGLDHIIVTMDRPKDPNASIYLDSTAALRGKPSITVEAGHAGTVEPEDVNALVHGCLNVMRYLKMAPGPATRMDRPVWIVRIIPVTSGQTGIFYPLVKRGTYVAEGMRIGYVTDYVGKLILDLHAPATGVLLYICAVPSMNKGDTVAYIGGLAR